MSAPRGRFVPEDIEHDRYLSDQAEQERIEAEYQADAHDWDAGRCTVCGMPSRWDECDRCTDERNRAEAHDRPTPGYSPGTPP